VTAYTSQPPIPLKAGGTRYPVYTPAPPFEWRLGWHELPPDRLTVPGRNAPGAVAPSDLADTKEA